MPRPAAVCIDQQDVVSFKPHLRRELKGARGLPTPLSAATKAITLTFAGSGTTEAAGAGTIA